MSDAGSPAPAGLQKNSLGVGAITFFVISAAGPLVAIAGGVPLGMLLGNGPGAPAGYAICVAVLLVFAAGFTAMARFVRSAGGFYAFIAQGVGPGAGAAAAVVAVVSYSAMQFGLYGMFGAACRGLLHDQLGVDVPWWLCAYGAMALIAWLGYRQVDLSARVLCVLVILEYAAVFILDVLILKHGGAQGISAEPFSPAMVFSGSPAIGLLFCFAAFIGFEATTIYSEEAKDPARTVPLATYASVLLIGGFYTFSSWCMVEGAGPSRLMDMLKSLADPTRFLFVLSNQYGAPWLTLALSVLFVTSVFAGLLAFHNAVARYLFALGREGLLPSSLAKTHPRHQSPHIGSVTQSLSAAVIVGPFVLLGCDPVLTLFSWLTNVATLGVLALMTVSSFAVIGFFRRTPPPEIGWGHRFLYPALSGLVLLLVAILAVLKFDVLAGTRGALAQVLPSIIGVSAIVGWILGQILRFRNISAYRRIGQNRED